MCGGTCRKGGLCPVSLKGPRLQGHPAVKAPVPNEGATDDTIHNDGQTRRVILICILCLFRILTGSYFCDKGGINSSSMGLEPCQVHRRACDAPDEPTLARTTTVSLDQT